jgi:hypothetical protein
MEHSQLITVAFVAHNNSGDDHGSRITALAAWNPDSNHPDNLAIRRVARVTKRTGCNKAESGATTAAVYDAAKNMRTQLDRRNCRLCCKPI